MPIGSIYALSAKNIFARLFFKFLGTPDLHTHIRLLSEMVFFDKYLSRFSHKIVKIVEPGCGSGVNAFEVAKLADKYKVQLDYAGIDTDEKGIETAREILKCGCIPGQFSFYKCDAAAFLEENNGIQADAVLLMDIIEHLADPRRMLKVIVERHLKEKGVFIVSVPTRLYPKFFGTRFHNKIGHIVSGYSLEELDSLFVDNLKCKRLEYKYSTGLISNVGCWLFYNLFNSENKYFGYLKAIALYPFKFLDIYNSPKTSCTLFAVYER